jgi:hypothetical protein
MSEATLNSIIEIHDSDLASVEQEGKRTKIALAPAYIHKSTGIPGVDPGTGWVQDVIVLVEDGIIEGSIPNLPCDLYDGTLQVNEITLKNNLPLPLNHRGKVELTLVAQSSERIVVRGTHISATLTGEPKYVEDFTGS